MGFRTCLKNIIFGRHGGLVGSIHEGKMIEGVLHFAAYSYIGESIKPVLDVLSIFSNFRIDSLNLFFLKDSSI